MRSARRSELAVSVSGLRKSYGDTVVLDGVDLTVAPGTMTALLGPNGAGKTTMVSILATLQHADGGSAAICGHDVASEPDAVRACIGLTGQFAAVDGILNGEENLMLMARLRHLTPAAARKRTAELLEQFDLVDAARQPLATYSGGMRRRLDLAMTLVTRPRVLFLDEPTTGLDPRSRRAVWDMVRTLVADGTAVLLTTQYLDEADHLADRIAMLHGSRVVAEGTPDQLKAQLPGRHARLFLPDTAALASAAAILEGSSADAPTLSLRVPLADGVVDLRQALSRLEDADVPLDDLTLHSPDLDDVFLALTGRAPLTGDAS